MSFLQFYWQLFRIHFLSYTEAQRGRIVKTLHFFSSFFFSREKIATRKRRQNWYQMCKTVGILISLWAGCGFFPWPGSARLLIISTFVIKMSLVRSTRVLLWKFHIIILPCQTPRARCSQHLEPVVYSSSPSCRKEIFGLQSGLAVAEQSWWRRVGKCSCANGSSTWSREELSRRLPSCFCGWSTHLAKPWRSSWPVTNQQSLPDLWLKSITSECWYCTVNLVLVDRL